MKYKKNNSFIQYFNKLYEKIRRKKCENCMVGRHDGGIVGWRAISLSPAQLAHLGLASPSCYSIWSCQPDPTFLRAKPRAKMGGPAQWTPLRLAMIPSQEHHHKLFKPWKSLNTKRHTEALYITFFAPN